MRELACSSTRTDTLMGTAFWLMIGAATVCYALMIGVIWWSAENTIVKIYISIISSGVFFATALISDYFFQANVQAKYSAMCKVAALFIMSVVKLLLIFTQADIFYFVVAALFDHIVLAVFLIIALQKINKLRFFKFFSRSDAKVMLSSAWPMVLTAVASLIYMRIDQIMIRKMLGLQEVGIYSAAVRVYEAWIVFPYIITVSLIPLIVKLKQGGVENYHRRLVQLFRLVIGLSAIAAIAVSLFGESMVVLAFGQAYSEAAPILSVVMWTAVFAAIGSVSARYFNVERMERKIAFRTLLAAALNVLLNLILIPAYGVIGAAFSTLFCTIFANYVMDWFDKDLKVLLALKHCAMFGVPIKRGYYDQQ
ncbi:Polysaccharide biosynthesis protein [compost metagenome]